MNIEKFLQNISFSFADPNVEVQPELQRVVFELSNTVLPTDGENYKKIFYDILKIPRMSTFLIGVIINKIVSLLPTNQAYVNVGVWHGFTFLAGLVNNPSKKCIGIDNFSEFGGPREEFLQRLSAYKSENHSFYEMDYVNYFTSVHQGSIGFYVYDGEHSYENQLKGLQIAEPFFAQGCLIMIDDANWEHVRQATFDFISSSNHQYKVVLDQQTQDSYHPTFWNGIIILQKVDG